jgi:AraC-like DNA-binding protein
MAAGGGGQENFPRIPLRMRECWLGHCHEAVPVLATVAVIAQSTGGDRTECWSSSRERLVRRAEDYMRAHLGGPLSVLDLCRELAVSERTLHYAFQEVRGLGPMAYFQAVRLNAAH